MWIAIVFAIVASLVVFLKSKTAADMFFSTRADMERADDAAPLVEENAAADGEEKKEEE